MISFHVDGAPQGQPRPRARYGKGPRGVYNPPGKAKGWIKTVEAVVAQRRPSDPIAGAVHVSLMFALQRPKSHFGTGRNSRRLKKSTPVDHMQTPDIDNLAKLILDCLTRLRYWHDDAQVIKLEVSKRWDTVMPGVWIHVKSLTNPKGGSHGDENG